MDYDKEECVICLEEYSNLHIPQTLPCSHMICDSCVANIPSENWECPLCRNPCTKSQIVPNFDLLSKLMGENLTNLNSLQKQFEERLDQVVQPELDKQLLCISLINKLEKEMIDFFSKIREKLNVIMNYNTGIKVTTLMRIEDDIGMISHHIKEDLGSLDFAEISKKLELVEKKYKERDIMISLRLFDCDFWTREAERICEITKNGFNINTHDQPLCLFGENSVRLVHSTANNFRHLRPNIPTFLFNPRAGNLTLMNMEKREKDEREIDLVDNDSVCYQLHPNTVCVVSNSQVIYIDVYDRSLKIVNMNFRREDFCLGRYKGDLTIIGGTCSSGSNGHEVTYLYKRKEWISLPKLQKSRLNAASESLNNQIYVFGGNPDLTIEVYNNGFWKLLPIKLCSSYSYIVSCLDSSSIYLLGGFTLENTTNMTIYKFDTKNNSIKPLETIDYEVFKTSNCSACFVDNKIFYNIGDSIYQFNLSK